MGERPVDLLEEIIQQSEKEDPAFRSRVADALEKRREERNRETGRGKEQP